MHDMPLMAFRAMERLGDKGHIHTANILRLNQGPRIATEAIDPRERIDEILPKIDPLMHDGLNAMEKVRVVRYAPHF